MHTIITKICIRCGEEKPRGEFYFGVSRRGKKYSHKKCKRCCIEAAQERYAIMSEEEKKVKHNTPSKKIYARQYRKEHPVKYMVSAARMRAKERDIEFSIQESDIVVPEICPYLGIPIRLVLDTGKGRGRVDFDSASLDRIDSTKGYVKGNVQIISHLANRMKNSATIEQLLDFARNVLTIHSK